jgi:Icc-related predicted phosphoesterase
MKVLILADLHGRMLLALKLAARLQRERNLTLDLILQCGDVGVFPDTTRLDKATLRHARHDETELGFSRYFTQPHPEPQAALSELECDMICVRGNHEDHEFLDKLERELGSPRFAVDCYKRIFMCKTGAIQLFEKNGVQLKVAGIGRTGSRKGQTDGRFIQEYEREALRKLMSSKEEIDILITHDSAQDFVTTGFGMTEIREALDHHKPFYHFFGHTGTPAEVRDDDNRFTTSCKVAELEWKDGNALPADCLALLTWNGPFDHSLELLEDKWITEYTASAWKHL